MRWLALILVACGSKPPATVADGCFSLAVAFCDKKASCGVGSDSCRQNAVADCCSGDFCKMPVEQCGHGLVTCCQPPNCTVALSLSVFDNCEHDIEQLSCGQLAAGALGCIPDAGQ